MDPPSLSWEDMRRKMVEDEVHNDMVTPFLDLIIGMKVDQSIPLLIWHNKDDAQEWDKGFITRTSKTQWKLIHEPTNQLYHRMSEKEINDNWGDLLKSPFVSYTIIIILLPLYNLIIFIYFERTVFFEILGKPVCTQEA